MLPEHDIITTEYHPAVHNGLQWYGGGLAHNSISQTYTAPPRYLLNPPPPLLFQVLFTKGTVHTASNTQRCRDPFRQYDATLLERKS